MDNTPTTPFLSIIKRKHDSFINAKINKYDLSVGTYPILIAIYKNDGIIQEEVANLFHLNESTITRAINKLEEKGFIEKFPDDVNKRKNYIKITSKGKNIASLVMGFEQEWDEYCFKNLTSDEFMDFKNILINICDNLLNESITD